ncbi:MAG: MBL fold metallo-hydrolase [Desulfobacca sp.]|nr:MBL fold metallo-hydrolase [Desulfobacca sp.]
MKIPKTFFVLICAVLFLAGCSISKGDRSTSNVKADQKLIDHSKEFERRVYQVAEGVYSAVGFGGANSIMLVGKDGVIIIDTMETNEECQSVFEEFRKITRLPVKAVIYTHFHPDHINGTAVYAQDAPEIYAHESLDTLITRFSGETATIIGARSMRMYGSYLEKQEVPNIGIGPFLGITNQSTLGYVPPTKTFKERLKATVAGIDFELIHAPGETDDQIYVWLSDRKILISADNLYKSFPNLYTIRGTWFRSLKSWYRSVDIIRDLRPDYLIPCHGRPIVGAEEIYRIATDYRDAIQFVHDQSLRGINQGLTADDLVEYVKLPEHLTNSPYLQEFYGKVSWSARSMFFGNLGWFSGDSADLQPLSRKEEAKRMAEIAGGENKLLEHLKSYFLKGDYQTALQLSGHLLRLNANNQEAREIRVKALTALGELETNAPARYYYLTEAEELRSDFIALLKVKMDPSMADRFPLSLFFDSLAARLDPQASIKVNKRIGIQFPDKGEAYTIHIRRGVAEIQPRLLDNLDMLVKADSKSWKEMLLNLRSPLTTLAGFEYKKGNTLEFMLFMNNFKKPKPRLSVDVE